MGGEVTITKSSTKHKIPDSYLKVLLKSFSEKEIRRNQDPMPKFLRADQEFHLELYTRFCLKSKGGGTISEYLQEMCNNPNESCERDAIRTQASVLKNNSSRELSSKEPKDDISKQSTETNKRAEKQTKNKQKTNKTITSQKVAREQIPVEYRNAKRIPHKSFRISSLERLDYEINRNPNESLKNPSKIK